jgi:Mn2+/Fe2+ NRAMP family transporter
LHFDLYCFNDLHICFIGKPKQLLLFAGAINGLILPVALAIILFAATKNSIMKAYRHPVWMQFAGWVVVAVMSWMGWVTIRESL